MVQVFARAITFAARGVSALVGSPYLATFAPSRIASINNGNDNRECKAVS